MDNPTKEVTAPNVYESRFSSEEVVVVAGINDSTLQNWLARGELNFKQQNPGRGKPRQYTLYEVVRIRFIKKLVDLAFPLAPAFKITGSLQRLWEKVPGGHEAYADEVYLTSLLFVAPAEMWNMRRRTVRFPLDHSTVQADGYVAIWAVEHRGSPNRGSLRDAIQFFEDAAVIVVNMGAVLKQTRSLLEQSLLARRDG